MNETKSANADDLKVIAGTRYKQASVKIIEESGEYVVIMRMFIFRRIPYRTKRYSFKTLSEAENQYEDLKAYLKRMA